MNPAGNLTARDVEKSVERNLRQVEALERIALSLENIRLLQEIGVGILTQLELLQKSLAEIRWEVWNRETGRR